MEIDACEPLSTLLPALQAVLPDADSAWIAKRARQGLLPSGKSIGLGPTGGSEVFYPIGTLKQMNALLYWLDKCGKNLELVGWMLWTRGFEVDQKYWLPKLRGAANQFARLRTELGKGENDEKIASALKSSAHAKRLTPGMGAVRRRVRDDLVHLLAVLATVLSGD